MIMDKETYFLKKMKVQFLRIFLLVQKSEEASIKQLSTGSDLSPSEMHTLVAIGRRDPKTMSEIAAELMVNVSTLSTAVSKLEGRGYVRRVKNESDRRVVRITLTAKGRRALDEHEDFYLGLIDEYIKNMTTDEKKECIHALSHIEKLLSDQMAEKDE
ncbi:MAG: MarR family transcriptional regulator [Anaerovoracaceae bacterium]|nr:MarR family transcriptional regulator [Bacillota bacterium]MDY2671296.1 MarR family transcriptional regulator [Anaerovoracaceae bacterium]